MTRAKVEQESKLMEDEIGILRHQGWLWVPLSNWNDLLHQVYYSSYAMHLGATKMCHDFKEVFW